MTATPDASATSPGLRGNYKWLVVGMLWFVCFFNYADRQAINGVFPVLEKEFHFTKTQLGLIGSAFMWVYAAGAPFAGFVCDRVRRKTLILGGCFFWSLVTVATGWCRTLNHFVLVRALEGFGETFYFPASMSLVSDYHGPATRSRAMAFHQSSVYIGTILGSWLGAYLAEVWNWRVGFYLFGTAGMVLSVLLWIFLIEPPRGQADISSAPDEPQLSYRQSLALMLREPGIWLLMAAFVGANFVATIFLTWAPTFLVDKFGYKLSTAGLNGTIYIHLSAALAMPMAGWVADFCSRRSRGGRMLPQAAGLLVGAIFVFGVGTATDRTTLLVAMTGLGLCKGFYDAGIFASMFDLVPSRARGSAAGIMNTVGWGGGALGPLFTGLYTQHGPYAAKIDNMSHFIAMISVVYLVSAILVGLAWFVQQRKQRYPMSMPRAESAG